MATMLKGLSTKKLLGGGEDDANSGYAVISKSLKECLKHVEGWTTGELTFGMYELSKQHAAAGDNDNIAGAETKDEETIKHLLHYLEYAEGAYEKDVKALCNMSMMKEANVVKHVPKSDNLRPAYWIGVDDGKKDIIMCVRGTASIADCLTDLSQSTRPIMGGEAPLGMHMAAQWFIDNELDTLAGLVNQYPEYGLMCTGHSLGAGTATLLCLLLRSSPQIAARIPPSKIRAIGYATPANLSLALSRNVSPFVTTVVCQDDLVPRGSLANVMELRAEILTTNWYEKITDDVEKNKYAKLAVGSAGAIASGYTYTAGAASAAYTATADASAKAAAAVAKNKAVASAVRGSMKMLSLARNAAKSETAAAAAVEAADGGALPPPAAAAAGGGADGAAAGERAVPVAEDEKPPTRMYAPGKLYHIRRRADGSHFLVEGEPSARFQRFILSGTMATDHLCTAYRLGLRDVLKG